jgi:hypothetical protein
MVLRASGNARSPLPETGIRSRVAFVLGIGALGALAIAWGVVSLASDVPLPGGLDRADDRLTATVNMHVLDGDFLRPFSAVAI